MDLQVTTNRRASTRFLEPGGRAVCTTPSASLRCGIRDASKGGIALSGADLELGTPVSLRLWWPMIGTAEASGVVCRYDANHRRIGVRYTDDGNLPDLLRNLSAIAAMRRSQPTPLFCGRNGASTMAIEQLGDAGFDHEHARTPLEALRLLQDPWRPLTTIVCDPTPVWLEFATFIGVEYSHLKRVLISDERGANICEEALESGIADGWLCEPWHPHGLYQELGLRLNKERCLSCGANMAATALAFCARCKARSTHLSVLDDLGGGD